jgi:glycosyltransferase involved in cell wall biosynthesis
MDISVIIPAYNEEGNIEELYSKLSRSLKGLKKDYEIIFVDDGSTDKTFAELEKLNKKDSKVRIIKFRKNFGQSAAWDAGFSNAKGNIVVTMDADLQNDPEDIQKLIAKLDEGFDVVSGWRANRKDSLSKKLFSSISRFFRKRIIDDRIHDSGCSLKAYKKGALEELQMSGEMHRYITELLSLKGYKIGEIKVNHLPRKHGKTKYNIIRLPKGFLDLIVVAFWQKYSARPIHLFGGIGILTSFLGFVIGAYLAYIKFAFDVAISNRPLLLLSALLVIVGIQFVIFGLIADILVKMFYSGKVRNYSIEKII